MKKRERRQLCEQIEQDFEILYWRDLHSQPKQYPWGWVYDSDGINVCAPTRIGASRKWKTAMKRQSAFLAKQAQINAAAQKVAGPWMMADKTYKPNARSELCKHIVVTNA